MCWTIMWSNVVESYLLYYAKYLLVYSSIIFIVSAFGGQKPQFWANFDIWGTPILTPFTDEGQIGRAIADLWCALGMVIEDLEHVLAPRKLVGVRRIVLPLRNAENLGKPDSLNLKPP